MKRSLKEALAHFDITAQNEVSIITQLIKGTYKVPKLPEEKVTSWYAYLDMPNSTTLEGVIKELTKVIEEECNSRGYPTKDLTYIDLEKDSDGEYKLKAKGSDKVAMTRYEVEMKAYNNVIGFVEGMRVKIKELSYLDEEDRKAGIMKKIAELEAQL